MSTEYLLFVSAFGLALTAASLVAFTERGNALVLSSVQSLGRRLRVCPWGLLHTFGHEVDAAALPPEERAALAESYIVAAEAQTLEAARVTVWVLISGLMFTALTGIVIAAVLPPYVEAGVWSYNFYGLVSFWLVRLNVAGGLAMGVGLATWLMRRTVRLNRTDGCCVARDIVLASRGSGPGSPTADEAESDGFPRLARLLRDVT